jgi:hypothetical protein
MKLPVTISESRWRRGVAGGGAIIGIMAGFFPNEIEQLLVAIGGLVLGIGALLMVTDPVAAAASTATDPTNKPTAWQGCLIAIGGALLGFFSCIGAMTAAPVGQGIDAPYHLGPLSILATFAVGGFVTAAGGLGLWLRRSFARIMSGNEEQP